MDIEQLVTADDVRLLSDSDGGQQKTIKDMARVHRLFPSLELTSISNSLGAVFLFWKDLQHRALRGDPTCDPQHPVHEEKKTLIEQLGKVQSTFEKLISNYILNLLDNNPSNLFEGDDDDVFTMGFTTHPQGKTKVLVVHRRTKEEPGETQRAKAKTKTLFLPIYPSSQEPKQRYLEFTAVKTFMSKLHPNENNIILARTAEEKQKQEQEWLDSLQTIQNYFQCWQCRNLIDVEGAESKEDVYILRKYYAIILFHDMDQDNTLFFTQVLPHALWETDGSRWLNVSQHLYQLDNSFASYSFHFRERQEVGAGEEEEPKEDEDEDSALYVIHAIGTTTYKIGMSNRAQDRLAQLQVANFFPLSLEMQFFPLLCSCPEKPKVGKAKKLRKMKRKIETKTKTKTKKNTKSNRGLCRRLEKEVHAWLDKYDILSRQKVAPWDNGGPNSQQNDHENSHEQVRRGEWYDIPLLLRRFRMLRTGKEWPCNANVNANEPVTKEDVLIFLEEVVTDVSYRENISIRMELKKKKSYSE